MELQQQPLGLIELLVRDGEGTATGDDFARWATQALIDGHDSSALRKLAGLNVGATASRFEARALLDRAIEELGLPLPSSHEELRRAYLSTVAREILLETRPVAEALETIHKQVLSPLNHPGDLMAWCYLWEGLDPETFASLDDAAIQQATRDLARRTVEGNAGRSHS